MYRTLKRTLSGNLYLFLGLILGLYMSSILQTRPTCHNNIHTSHLEPLPDANEALNSITNRPKNLTRKETSSKKPKPIRPRYYSTELGIREKLFVGIITSEENINTQAVHINATVGHLVEKVKFFISAQRKLRTRWNLTGVVGFTDTRHKYRVFQIVKYVADSFLLDYDFFFFVNDYSFVNARELKEAVGRVSVSMNVYMGTAMADSTFCSLDAGIVISNSVLKALKENLEWCVTHAISEDSSENFGRCVYHSTGLDCQESVQDQKLTSYKLRHSNVEKHLPQLVKRDAFLEAVTVYPVLQAREFYLLNAFFAQRRLKRLKAENEVLSRDLTESWPAGQRPGNKPGTRFDLPRRHYFNESHLFFPDDFTNVRAHTAADKRDIEAVVGAVKAKVAYEQSSELLYRRFVNGYRTFDLSRGMDYLVDLGFRDLNTGKEVIKRFEVCKPLGKVEFIPAPYVTENTRITVLLPVEEHQLQTALDFLRRHSQSVMDKNDKTFLMLVLLYQSPSPSKGRDDVFYSLKSAALKLRAKYQNEDAKIAWLSIRLPERGARVTVREFEVLNYAVVDLGLRKVGLESLILVLDAYTELSLDFLNRVRMNTIEGYQMFGAIPFRQYDPSVTGISRFDIHKNVGHFDREQYRYLSFYAKDYVNARKKSQHLVPIIKSDNDIVKLFDAVADDGNVFEMFVRFGDGLHCMRATEMSLKVRFHEEEDEKRKRNWFLGNKAQLAAMILSKREQIRDI